MLTRRRHEPARIVISPYPQCLMAGIADSFCALAPSGVSLSPLARLASGLQFPGLPAPEHQLFRGAGARFLAPRSQYGCGTHGAPAFVQPGLDGGFSRLRWHLHYTCVDRSAWAERKGRRAAPVMGLPCAGLRSRLQSLMDTHPWVTEPFCPCGYGMGVAYRHWTPVPGLGLSPWGCPGGEAFSMLASRRGEG